MFQSAALNTIKEKRFQFILHHTGAGGLQDVDDAFSGNINGPLKLHNLPIIFYFAQRADNFCDTLNGDLRIALTDRLQTEHRI